MIIKKRDFVKKTSVFSLYVLVGQNTDLWSEYLLGTFYIARPNFIAYDKFE